MITMLFLLISTYPWPIRQFDLPHPVSATLGDARESVADPRFHRGIDIPAGAGTGVFSLVSGTAISTSYSVRVGDYFYDHLQDPIDNGEPVLGIVDTTTTPPDIIGKVSVNHLHFQIGPPGGPYYNPLFFDGGPVLYDDDVAPVVSSVDFWRQGL